MIHPATNLKPRTIIKFSSRNNVTVNTEEITRIQHKFIFKQVLVRTFFYSDNIS